ncbi:MAG: hypothetical protein Ct9H300mP28_31970 [Pseudomonadota bacterium]|nr:MAG: hypothetical protein Ct9H300mP28_31970 [Pseudomonadota bacterium]
MNEHYGAILLAGGRSSRRGQEKATLVISGKTMLEDCYSVCPQICAETV